MEIWIDEHGRFRTITLDEGTEFFTRHFGLERLRVEPDEVSMLWAIDQVVPDALQVMRKYLAEHGGAATYRTEFFHGGWASENYEDKWAALDRVKNSVPSAASCSISPSSTVLSRTGSSAA